MVEVPKFNFDIYKNFLFGWGNFLWIEAFVNDLVREQPVTKEQYNQVCQIFKNTIKSINNSRYRTHEFLDEIIEELSNNILSVSNNNGKK